MKRSLQLLLLAAGLAAFAWTVRAAGLERLSALGPALAGPGLSFLLVYAFMCAWDVAGWQVLFPPETPRPSFGGLYLIRLAGEAFNNITPFVDVGGEFLKVTLTAGRFGVRKKSALASVVVERSLLFFSEILFWALGAALVRFVFPAAKVWDGALFATLAVCAALGAALWAAQRKGFFLSVMGALRSLGLEPKLPEKLHLSMREIDAEIAAFYSGEAARGRLSVSLVLHFVGWVAGGLEMYVLFRLAGAPIALGDAVLFESFFQLLRTASFFIPGNLGAQEAGLAVMARWTGHDFSAGVAVSLLKRLRQLVWTAVGFAVWAALKPAPESA
ncbi:MAG TPA: lysylphosphatidylglycerol synthase transmembrane domain-containing protein [Candidatus Eisenbacteria bacterium]|nr:lysylphosphatidylglycerol synthase transmembrane domain-containing protein [Candidatus Eisenbacteria bacterium]